jgi:hypothetical protein
MASDAENFSGCLETTTHGPLDPTQVKEIVPLDIPTKILGLSDSDLTKLFDLWNSQIDDPQSDNEFEKSPDCSKILAARKNRKPRRAAKHNEHSIYRDDGSGRVRLPEYLKSELRPQTELTPQTELNKDGWWCRFSKSLSSLFCRVAPTDFEGQLAPAGPGKSLRDPRPHLYTEAKEPMWELVEERFNRCFFPGGWNYLKAYKLPRSDPFVYEEDRSSLELWKQFSVNVNAGLVGVQIQGAAPIINAVSHKQYLSIWRGRRERWVYVRDSINPNICDLDYEPDVEVLRNLDDEIFGTAKYRNGTSEYLTVLTYTEEELGAISLFKAVFEDEMHVAARLDFVANLPEVPQNILRQLRRQVTPNRVDLRYKGTKLRYRNARKQPLPFQCTVKTSLGERWSRSGSGWRQSLRLIDFDDEKKSGGLIASIPQMMALLHLKNKYLIDVRSTPVVSFTDPLRIPFSPTLHPGEMPKRIRRGLKLLGAAEGHAHIGSDIRVVVFFPLKSEWAKEEIYWA